MAEDLERLDENSATRAFVISPIGDDGSAIRRRADSLLHGVVRPVAADLEVSVVRADGLYRPGSVTTQIVLGITSSNAVIVDLAGSNPNVYYELGIADSFAIPTIIFTDDASLLPFDVRDQRVIQLADTDGRIDVLDALAARVTLSHYLQEARSPGYQPTSVVSTARVQAHFDLVEDRAAASSNPMDQLLARLARQVDLLVNQAGPSSAGSRAPATSVTPTPVIAISNLDQVLVDHDEWVRSEGARGTKADLAEANLTGVDLSGKVLSGADMRNVNLRSANLAAANMAGANLRWANLTAACLDEADLSQADLTRANLAYASLQNATLQEADLTRANLREANLLSANMGDAELKRATLREAQASGANLVKASLTGVNLRWADLTAADLHEATIFDGNLEGANFLNADLTNLRFDGDTNWPEGFRPAEHGAVLVEVYRQRHVEVTSEPHDDDASSGNDKNE